jgi:hypothetical protein
MATLRPNWFLISPVLTAAGACSWMSWKRCLIPIVAVSKALSYSVPCVFGAGVVRRQQLRWRLEKDDERGHHVRDACRDARNHGFLGLGAP